MTPEERILELENHVKLLSAKLEQEKTTHGFMDLEYLKKACSNYSREYAANVILSSNGLPLTHVEHVLNQFKILARERPLDTLFFHNSINEMLNRHGRFLKDLLSGKLDDE